MVVLNSCLQIASPNFFSSESEFFAVSLNFHGILIRVITPVSIQHSAQSSSQIGLERGRNMKTKVSL